MSDLSSVSKGRMMMGLMAVLAASLISSPARAQSDANPKWDLFLGYQWLHPGGTVPAPGGSASSPTLFKVPDLPRGGGAALTYNFDPRWGAEFDLGYNTSGDSTSPHESTLSAGPRFMWRTETGNYFLHSLVSLNRVSISGLDSSNGIGAILGGGMDIPLIKGLSWRLFEADYVWTRHNYAASAAPQFPDLRRPTFNGVRLRTGLVFSWGGTAPAVPAANCSVQPNEVIVGEPITATVSASNFNPKHTVTYSWTANGGQVTGKGTTAQIDTTNAAPGSYTITAHATDAKEKKNGEATCTANFSVKPLPPKNPPTLSLSANPASVQAGGTVNLSANCTSPDGVPVNVAAWTATGGTISGSGSSATLNTAGASPGPITVGASCTDSRGLTGQAMTQVMVENPPPPPAPSPEIVELEARLRLHSIYFPTDQPRPESPKGGLLPSQQKTLTVVASDFKKYLESKPDAHLILEGHADPRGSDEYNQKLSERRDARVQSFLIEQGIPVGNIETKAYGKQRTLTDAEVKDAVENNPELTNEEKQRVLRNTRTIVLASDRRVDITLSTTGQTSVRQFPFNSTDALTLIGGRESEKKKVTKPVRKKPAAKP